MVTRHEQDRKMVEEQRNRVPGSIGVLDSPDHPMPISTAYESGWTEGGLAIWRPTVKNADVPGRWVIVDRKFRPVEG
jgi:hypothetical protein